MNIRKKSLKILALTLSVALLGIGAAPATADCSNDCCCIAPSKIQFQDITPISQMTRHMQEYERMHEGSHQVHTFFLLVQSDTKRNGCEQRTTESSCGVEPLPGLEVLHCSLQTNPRAEHIFYAYCTVNAGMIETDSLFFGPAANDGLMVRAGPQPLYLQNLSLLI
ncbi:MAG: hypothetical protein JRJ51_16380 [Deltaproteobacteria bacterium]|nr:hypothetical protein [Deltaproteobacteria bacterium]